MDPRRQKYEFKLQGKTSIGAVLTVGRAPNGLPQEKDRFFIHTYTTDKRVLNGKSVDRRELHPDFRDFNLESSGGAEIYSNSRLDSKGSGIRIFRGTIVHASRNNFSRSGFAAMKALPGKGPDGKPWPIPPNKRPSCEGDGNVALRYFGENDWREVPCLGDTCEFRQKIGKAVPCALKTWLLFQPRWPNPKHQHLSAPLMLWDTKSRWHSGPSLAGMLDEVEAVAASNGIDSVNWSGFPFVMYLSESTSSTEGTKFPVVSFAWDLPGGTDILTALRQQAEARQAARLAIGAGSPVLALPTASEVHEDGGLDHEMEFVPVDTFVTRVPAVEAIPITPPAQDLAAIRSAFIADVLAAVAKEDAASVVKQLTGNSALRATADLTAQDIERAREAMKNHPLFANQQREKDEEQ